MFSAFSWHLLGLLLQQGNLTVPKGNPMSNPKVIDLSSVRAERRKKGRVAKHDPQFIADLLTLEHGEGMPYHEAYLDNDEYQKEFAKAKAGIAKANPDADPESVFQNRWLSRYRQRAQSAWNSAGLPKDEFDFVILNDGRVIIGRK
jgi:hypothetical protein